MTIAFFVGLFRTLIEKGLGYVHGQFHYDLVSIDVARPRTV